MDISADVLVFQEYSTPEGMRYLVWLVPGEEFLKLEAEYKDSCCNPNDSRKWALDHFTIQNRAKFMGATDMDAELFAANLRESGFKAKHMRDYYGRLEP